jgi:hypothetical protein
VKALTIWQPWASLIAAGAKPYEFRAWRFPSRMIGERVVNHAGSRPMRESEILDLIERLNGPDAWSTALHRDAAMPVLELALADVRRPKPKKADLFGPGDAIDPPNLPIGAGIGSFVLGTPRDGDVIAREFGMPAVNDSDRDQEANWGWPVEQVQTWREPVPSKGAQGFWHWQGGGLAQFVGAL